MGRNCNPLWSRIDANILPMSPRRQMAWGAWLRILVEGGLELRRGCHTEHNYLQMAFQDAGWGSASVAESWANDVIVALIEEQPTQSTIYDGGANDDDSLNHFCQQTTSRRSRGGGTNANVKATRIT